MTQTSIRTASALLLVLVTAAIIFGLTHAAAPALIALIGSTAAVSIAGRKRPAGSAVSANEASVSAAQPLIAVIGEALADPLLVIRDSRIIVANPPARALLGEHIVGEDVRLVIRHPAAAERLVDPAGDGASLDLVGLGKGEQRWAMRVSPVGDGYRAIHLVDQTAAYAAERMRVDFVANASHELKTPLSSLLGYAETLRDEAAAADPELRTRFLTIMTGEATRMHRLVDDLISLSRIEADKYRLPSAAVDLGALVEGAVSQIQARGDARADDLVVSIEPGLPPVNGDAAQLSQLLHNLIDNAMKYGTAGTPVTVELAADDGLARLVVADRGEGIAREHIPRLTERFYRAEPSRSRALGGTGLGLAIVKHIVERHRGRLDIASTVGQGTTVTVLLPLSSS